MNRRVLLSGVAGAAACALVPASRPSNTQAAGCQFVLGFRTLHDLIPEIVGECKTDEYHNPVNGDGLQETTAWHGKGGLLVWRKSDNWTAYTDGIDTWINGPNGLQKRPNLERFDWENDPQAPTVAPSPTPGPRFATYSDDWMEYRFPVGWSTDAAEYRILHFAPKIDGNDPAALTVRRAYRLGAEYPVYGYASSRRQVANSASDYLDQLNDALLASQAYTTYQSREIRQLGDAQAIVRRYAQYHGARDIERLGTSIGVTAVVSRQDTAVYVQIWTRERYAESFVGLFDPIVNSFVVKRTA